MIFISYRKDDSQQIVDHLAERLKSAFGDGAVFKDDRDIGDGEHWPIRLQNEVKDCDALLAVIGSRWLTAAHRNGRRRLDDPDDWVRQEITTALNLGKRVIPILVSSAEMPLKDDLPDCPILRQLCDRQSRRLRSGSDSERDIGALIEGLRNLSPTVRVSRGKTAPTVSASSPQLVAGNVPDGLLDHFKDRQDELCQLREALIDDRRRMVPVCGPQGMGKTTLVTKLIREIEEAKFTIKVHGADTKVDGIVYLAVREAFTLGDVVKLIIEVLDEPSAEVLEQKWFKEQSELSERLEFLFRHVLANRRCLIVLDDLEVAIGDNCFRDEKEFQDLEKFMEKCLEINHRARIVAISDQTLPLSKRVEADFRTRKRPLPPLRGLPVPFGVALLNELDVDGVLGIHRADQPSLADVVRRCKGIPGRLNALVATVGNLLVSATLVEFVADEIAFKDFLKNPDEAVYMTLSPEQQLALGALSVFDGPVLAEGVRHLLKIDQNDEWKALLMNLDALVKNQVILLHNDKRIEVHPYYQEYAYRQIPQTGNVRQELHKRAAEFFRLNRKKSSDAESHETQLREYDQLVHAGLYDRAERLLLEFHGPMMDLGDAGAVSERRIHLHEQLTDPKQKAQNLRCLGLAWAEQGEHEQALDCYRKSHAIGRKIGDKRVQCAALICMGWACNELGKFDKALEFLDQAELLKSLSRHMMGVLRGNRGDAYLNKGEFKSVIELSNEAWEIHRETKSDRDVVVWLGNLGEANHQLGDLNKAIAYYKKALRLEERNKFLPQQRVELCRLGRAYFDRANFQRDDKVDVQQSIRYYDEAITIASKIGDKLVLSRALFGRGMVCHFQEDLVDARKYYESALEMGVPKTSHHCEIKLGILSLEESKKEVARKHFSRGIALCKEMLKKAESFDAFYHLALAQLGGKTPAEAFTGYERAINLCAAAGVVRSALIDLRLLERAAEASEMKETGAAAGVVRNALKDLPFLEPAANSKAVKKAIALLKKAKAPGAEKKWQRPSGRQ